MSTLDVTVILTLIILMAHTWSRLNTVSLAVKLVHFGLYAVLLRIAISGLSYFISFSVRPYSFIAAFRQHSSLLVPTAILVSFAGFVISVCLMPIGAFNRKARDVFAWFSVPYFTLFPLIMLKSIDSAASNASIILMMFAGLLLSIFAIYFYKIVMKEQFEPKSK